jgi:hypothetical protein
MKTDWISVTTWRRTYNFDLHGDEIVMHPKKCVVTKEARLDYPCHQNASRGKKILDEVAFSDRMEEGEIV